MDKEAASENLKKYLALAKKHRFWILCLLIVLIAAPVYTIQANSLRAKREESVREIERWSQQVKQISSSVYSGPQERPKNEKFITGLEKEGEKIKDQAYKAWEQAYERQQERLVWPELVAEIGNLKPGETISTILSSNYVNRVIEPEWERVFNKVRLWRVKPNQGPLEQGKLPEMEGIVEWDEKERNAIIVRSKPSKVPSDLRVRITQEDLWIFESLIDIINKVNANAQDAMAAKIRRIEKLEVGRPAIEYAMAHSAGEVKIPNLPQGMGPGSSQNSADSDDEVKFLLAGRYLDANNQPVPAEMARDNPPFAEFKQVFVVMRLVMDQREIPNLLAACANSHLPIEARQVWMEFQDIDTVQAKTNKGGTAASKRHGHYDCTVEIRGIVYIYQPPVPEKLGMGNAPNPAQRSLGIPSTLTGANE